METALASTGISLFLTQMLAPLLVCSAIPLGVPPAAQDPALTRLAPRECLLYLGWAGAAEPDAKSANRAERFLADPEIRHVRAEAHRRFQSLLAASMTNGQGPGAKPGGGPLSPGDKAGGALDKDVGFWLDLLFTQPGAFYVSRYVPDKSQVHGGLVLEVGKHRERVTAMLQQYYKLAAGQIAQAQVAGQLEYSAKSADGTCTFRWALWEKYLILAWGEETPQAIIQRMSGKEPEWLAAISQDLPVQRRSVLLHFECKPLLDALAAQGRGPQATDLSWARHVRAINLAGGLEGEDYVSRVQVELHGDISKVLHVLANRPLRPEDLASIPRDATLAAAFRVDPEHVLSGLLWLQKEADRASQVPAAPALAAKKADFSPGEALCREIAASLDDAWCLYTSPSEGMLVITGLTGTVRVKDRARLARTLEKLAVEKPQGGNWSIHRNRFADRDVFTVVSRVAPSGSGESTGNVTINLPFSWCLTEKELVWSLSPQGLKAYLLRDAGHPSLSKTPAVAEVLQPGHGPTLLCYEDAPELFRLTYPVMQFFATAVAGQAGGQLTGIDPMLLPAAPTIAKYLRPAVTTVQTTPKGIEMTMRQSLPCGNLGATLWVVGCSMLPAEYADGASLGSAPLATLGSLVGSLPVGLGGVQACEAVTSQGPAACSAPTYAASTAPGPGVLVAPPVPLAPLVAAPAASYVAGPAAGASYGAPAPPAGAPGQTMPPSAARYSSPSVPAATPVGTLPPPVAPSMPIPYPATVPPSAGYAPTSPYGTSVLLPPGSYTPAMPAAVIPGQAASTVQPGPTPVYVVPPGTQSPVAVPPTVIRPAPVAYPYYDASPLRLVPVTPVPTPQLARDNRVAYLDCGDSMRADTGRGVHVRQIRGSHYTFPGADSAADRRFATCVYDEAGPMFEFSRLDPGKSYRLGFSWWDYDQSGRVESVVATSGGGQTSTLLEKAVLPAYLTKRQLPAETTLFLPKESYASGMVRVTFTNDSKAANAVVSEVWLTEEPQAGSVRWVSASPPPPFAPPGPSPSTPPAIGPARVSFTGPKGMVVRWDERAPGVRESLIVPGQIYLTPGALYRVRLSNVGLPKDGKAEFPSVLEISPIGPWTQEFFARNAIPVQFAQDDFEQALRGTSVTKVIYLPHPEFREVAGAVETLVSTRLDPGTDPMVEAGRRGTILGVVRMGPPVR